MISKSHRFHGFHALDYTYRRGKTVRSDLLSLRFAPAKNKEYRLAVVVSRKVHKSAVVRNRIRRRLYEIVRKIHKGNPLPPKDMILTAHDEQIATLPAAELHDTVARLIERMVK